MGWTARTSPCWAAVWMASGLLLWACTCQAQGIFKWVDAQGKTHYGSQPPTNADNSESVQLRSPSGFGGNNNRAARPAIEYNTDGTKKIPKDVQELGDGLIKGLQKVSPKTVPLDCARSVSTIHDQADMMLSVGEKNRKDGYINPTEFDSQVARIRQAKSETSVADCQLASGNKKLFYQCMSNDHNHVTGCAKKHPY
ncbi:MAG: DUF4124 domain-containing protein [Rhodoferax sp.]|nr:DUF4124 domain-containing protein [Rhodoferax sp.]